MEMVSLEFAELGVEQFEIVKNMLVCACKVFELNVDIVLAIYDHIYPLNRNLIILYRLFHAHSQIRELLFYYFEFFSMWVRRQ